jgi:predicted RNA-binding protein with PIN domain
MLIIGFVGKVMGTISTKTSQSTFHETIHYSQVLEQNFDELVVYQSPISKLSARYLHKITVPYTPTDETLSTYIDKYIANSNIGCSCMGVDWTVRICIFLSDAR